MFFTFHSMSIRMEGSTLPVPTETRITVAKGLDSGSKCLWLMEEVCLASD